jgi:zinc finger protein
VTIKPGPAGEGFISNIEGVLKRVERAIKLAMQNATEEQIKRGSSRLEKLQKVLNGQLRAKIIVIDPSGNSAIIDERAKKQELRS